MEPCEGDQTEGLNEKDPEQHVHPRSVKRSSRICQAESHWIGFLRTTGFAREYNLDRMNLKIHSRHFRVRKSLKRLIERRSRQVQKILPTFAPRDLDLHINLEKLTRGKQYHTMLVLIMPQNSLRVEAMKGNPATSILRAFDELVLRVKKYKSRLNRERFWQQEPGPPRKMPPIQKKHELEDAINQNLLKLENYIRRELYHRRLIESIPAGVLQTQALVDEVFLDVSSRASSRPENLPLAEWMFQRARVAVRKRIQDLLTTRDEPHVEETVPASSKWDDEELDFHQPDEVLHLADLISDEHSVSPEELLAREEAVDKLQKEIANLPSSVRESFVLFSLEGFNSDETAMITGKKSADVLSEVEEARLELRKRLI